MRKLMPKVFVFKMLKKNILRFILGIGMCCTMIQTNFYVLGIIMGIIGIVICGYAYPLYKKVIREKREKFAPQILKLTEEIERGTRF